MGDDLFSRDERIEAELAASHAQHEAELAAERAKEERIRAAIEAGTAADRQTLAERRDALRAATMAALRADVERDRVCHRGNKH